MDSYRRRIVLGYCGLDGSKELRHRWLGEEASVAQKQICQGQDSAAALVVDGELVAAVQEERFTGRKFDGTFPVQAISWCLDHAGIDFEDVDAIAHNFDFRGFERSFSVTPLGASFYREVADPRLQDQHFERHFGRLPDRLSVQPVKHHDTHAWSAISWAGFEDATVLTLDGVGEVESVAVFRWRDGKLSQLASMGVESSLGMLYALVTLHLGFLPGSDEYKVMGLAPYGDPEPYAEVMRKAVELQPGHVNVPVLDWQDGNQTYDNTLAWLAGATFPPRDRGHQPVEDDMNLAAAIQRRVEEALFHLADTATNLTGNSRLLLSGGVALNCAAVGRLRRETNYKEVLAPPAPADDGTAIGAAFAVAGYQWDEMRWPSLPLLGPNPEWAGETGWSAKLTEDEMIDAVAHLLADGAIVGWARGRLEFGPRALGGRSILANPADPAMRDRINAVVKGREDFRPLAPIVLAEHAGDYFEIPSGGVNLRHMTTTVKVKASARAAIPAVTHVDNTARVQVLHPEESPSMASLLARFHALTGLPVLINTSLNVVGQPIARTVDQILNILHTTELDAVAVDDRLWSKRTFGHR